jgi:hypothetical protein
MEDTHDTNEINSNMNMDETEDEEVKRNCFGMKHYETSSDEESDEESVASGSVALPVKFACDKPSGIDVFKPTPLNFQLTVEKRDGHTKKHIIHNECEFSDDESSASDEASVQSDEDGFQEEIDDLEDSASEASDEGSDELEESFSADEAVEETSNQDEPSDAASNCSDADDETSGEQSDEEQEEGGRVIVDWGQHTGDSSHCLDNVEYSTGLVTKVSGNASDNDSVSAEQIQDFIEKPETTDICFSDTDQTEDTEDDDDVMKCLIDPGQEFAMAVMPPLKRFLSNQMAMNVSPEEDNCSSSQSKRCRMSLKNQGDTSILGPYLPVLSLGPTADMNLNLVQRRRNSQQFSASSDEEVADNQLAEELMDGMSEDVEGRGPVPLLTPPSTPIEQSSSTGQIAICEWPSNLAVDNALTAAMALRSLSPSSLVRLEEQNPTKGDFLSTPTQSHQRLRAVSNVSNTGLTPILTSLVWNRE